MPLANSRCIRAVLCSLMVAFRADAAESPPVVPVSDASADTDSASVPRRIQRVEGGLLPDIVIAGRPAEHFKIDERMRFYKTPGVSVAVVNNGMIEWARGYG